MLSPSHGTSPSAPRARISTKGIGGPCWARLSYAAAPESPRSWPGAPEIVPIGHISVMPQPWVMWMPWRSPNASISARGGAEPPTVIVRMRDRSQPCGFASSACRIPIQIVGTPALAVTPSSTKASRRLSGSRCGPGKTCLAPTSVQLNGKHQAFAWNIGTTGRTVSPSWRARRPTAVSAWIAIARCE